MHASLVSKDLLRTFVPPTELARSRPRDVHLTAGGRSLVIVAWLCVAGAIAGGVALHREARRQSADAREMDRRGIAATAVIDRLWRKSAEGKPAYAAFHFDASGTRIDGESRMQVQAWRALRVSATVPVRYRPEAPRQFVLAGAWRPSRMPEWLSYLVSAALIGMALRCAAVIHRQRTLLVEGRPAPAVVTAVQKHHSSHGGTHHTLSYEFPLLGGGSGTGKVAASRKPAAVGTTICVVYDPDRPQRSQLYPFSLVALEPGERR